MSFLLPRLKLVLIETLSRRLDIVRIEQIVYHKCMRKNESIGRFLMFGLLLAASVGASAAELIMVEEDFCPYCRKFHAEIGPIYPKTSEGKLAPLRSVDISDPLSEEIELAAPVTITPTFILVDKGKEVDRLLGYQGDDYFWFLIGKMLAKLEN